MEPHALTARARYVLALPLGLSTLLFTHSVKAEPPPPTVQVVAPGSRPSPVGDWYTIHEETNKATSVVRIAWEGEELVGRVVKVLAGSRGPNPICDLCAGERKDKPVVGMSILWGLKSQGDVYAGGSVLDPSKGKVYRAKVKMRSNETLELRGFLGVSLFGRTQLWQRVSPSSAPSATTEAAK